MSTSKIIAVTGANRGIGREICRQLHEMGHKVILTARNAEKGRKAAESLGTDFSELDVNDGNSISAFYEYVESTYGVLDVLINNAGIMIDGSGTPSGLDMNTLRDTMETNFFGPFRLSQVMLPLLEKSKDPRIVNMSSGMGEICNGYGANQPSYRISKTALNAFTRALAADRSVPGVKVNAMCPGWVKTDMGGAGAPKSVEEGADTAVWLATGEGIPNGSFFRNREEIHW